MLVTVSSPPGTRSSEALPSRGKIPGGELRCLGESHLLQKTKKGRPSDDSVGASALSCRLLRFEVARLAKKIRIYRASRCESLERVKRGRKAVRVIGRVN